MLMNIGTQTVPLSTIFDNLMPDTNYTAIVFAKSTKSEYIVVDGSESDPIAMITFSTCRYIYCFPLRKQMRCLNTLIY